MASSTKHILLIDDDQDDAELFSDAIEELRIDAVVAHFFDGNEGLEKLKRKEISVPDVIFLDVNMPHINGWDCLREIKMIAHLRKIPIVMYSTSSFDRQGVEAKDIGADAFLTKPGNFHELKAKLSSVLTALLQG
jgi:CheY-like chemotaxis protein